MTAQKPWTFYLPNSREPVVAAPDPLVERSYGRHARFARLGARPLGVIVRTRKNWRVIATAREPTQGLAGEVQGTFRNVGEAVDFLAKTA